jgi:hypothetical protein
VAVFRPESGRGAKSDSHAWAYVVGIYVNEYIKPIRIKNDGKRTKSLYKYGLETIPITSIIRSLSAILISLNFCHVLKRIIYAVSDGGNNIRKALEI